MEELKLPNLFEISGYKIFFWSNENFEPIHIHISKGKPSKNSTKIWLTRAGGAIVANNDSKIPQNELNKLLEMISAQHFFICRRWKEHFKVKEIKFYC